MYKAIFIDIDGTLRNNQKELTKKTIQSVKNTTEKGTLVILCSGRPKKYTEDVSRECYASKYVVTSNGGNIYDYEKKEDIYNNIMNKKAIIELYKLTEQYNLRFIMNVGENRTVNRVKYDDLEVKLNTSIEEFVGKNDVIQCTIADSEDEYEKIKSLRPYIEKVEGVEIKNQHKSLTDSNAPIIGEIYYDVANKESCKGRAIKILRDYLRIDKKDTIGIGDDFNDLSMFEEVGYKVVMGNANDKIKKIADKIIDTNENDGVAKFLDNLENIV